MTGLLSNYHSHNQLILMNSPHFYLQQFYALLYSAIKAVTDSVT